MAFLTCEEEFEDRFDDYAEDEYFDNYNDEWGEWDEDPMTTDEFMDMVLDRHDRYGY